MTLSNEPNDPIYVMEGYDIPAEGTSGYIQKDNQVLGFAGNKESTEVYLQGKVNGTDQIWERSIPFIGHFTLKSLKNNHYLHGNLNLERLYIGPACYNYVDYDNNDKGT